MYFFSSLKTFLSFRLSFLAKLKAGEVQVTSYDFPYFMYDPDTMDGDDIRAGLCRGFLLIRVSLFFVQCNDTNFYIAERRRDVLWEWEAPNHQPHHQGAYRYQVRHYIYHPPDYCVRSLSGMLFGSQYAYMR